MPRMLFKELDTHQLDIEGRLELMAGTGRRHVQIVSI